MRIKQKVPFLICLFLFISFSMLTLSSSEPAIFSGSLGLTPNTMGTVGETLQFEINAFRFLSIAGGFHHDIVYHHDLEFEKLGGPLFGDLYKDILSAELQAGGRLRLGTLQFEPFFGFSLSRTNSDSIAGIITVVEEGVDPFPRDIEAFVDIDETEFVSGFNGGARIAYSIGSFSMTLTGTYFPLLASRLSGGFFQNYGDFPSSEITDAYPAAAEYWWRENSYKFNGSGTQYFIGGRFGAPFRPLNIRISGFGSFRKFIYDGGTSINNKYYYPQREEFDSDTNIIESSWSALARVDVTDWNLEAGFSFALEFFEIVFGLPGFPVIDISYVRSFRDIEFAYYDPFEDREKWVEDYDFTRFSIYWDL